MTPGVGSDTCEVERLSQFKKREHKCDSCRNGGREEPWTADIGNS